MTTVPVSFVWVAPGPESVSVLGTWEGATETPLQKQDNGSFVAEIQLTPGTAYFFSYIVDGKKTHREDIPWSSSGGENLNILSSIVDSGVTHGTTDSGYEPKSKTSAPATATEKVTETPAEKAAETSTEKPSGEETGIVASIAGAAAAGAGIVGATVASLTGSDEQNKDASGIQPPGTGAPIPNATTKEASASTPFTSTLYTTGSPSVYESRQGQVLTQSVPIGHARLDDIDAPVRPAPAISTDYAALLRQTGPVETTSTYLQPVTATESTAPSVSSRVPTYAAAGAGTGVAAGAATGAATSAPTNDAAAGTDDDSHEPWSVEWPQSASKSQANFTRPDPLLHAEQSNFGAGAWSVKEGKAAEVPGSAANIISDKEASTGAAGASGTTGAAGAAAGAADSKPKETATDAVSGGKQTGIGAVEDAKKAGTGAVDDAKKTGTDAVSSGKDAAKSGNVSGVKDAATGAADDAKKTGTGAVSDAKGKAEQAPKKLGFFGKIKKALKK